MKTQATHTMFCPRCGTHTPQVYLVNQYGTRCTRCKSVISGIERSDTESTLFTPDGYPARVVRNDASSLVFQVDNGEHQGLYVYDKQTGFGAIQNRGQAAY